MHLSSVDCVYLDKLPLLGTSPPDLLHGFCPPPLHTLLRDKVSETLLLTLLPNAGYTTDIFTTTLPTEPDNCCNLWCLQAISWLLSDQFWRSWTAGELSSVHTRPQSIRLYVAHIPFSARMTCNMRILLTLKCCAQSVMTVNSDEEGLSTEDYLPQ